MLSRLTVGFGATAVFVLTAMVSGCSGGSDGNGPAGPGQGPSGAEMIARYDTDGDGALWANESPPELAAEFTAIDADGNAQLTAAEIDAWRAAAAQGGASGGSAGGFAGLGGGSPGGPGGSGGGLLPSQTCASTEITTEPGIPTVELVVDRSFSMNDPTPNGQAKWVEACDAVKEVVFPLTNEVAFGYHGYTFDSLAGWDCPTLIEVPASTGNADALFQTMIDNPPPFLGTTPTAEALDAVADQIASARQSGDTSARTILLVTDGEPNACEGLGGDGIPRTEQAAERICNETIRMNVIWIGDLTSAETQAHMQRMADLGAGACNDASITGTYYTVQTGQELQQVLTEIVSGVLMCVLHLQGKGVNPDAACDDPRSSVTFNGRPIPCGPNGWRLTGPTTLEFLGDACLAMQSDPTLIVKAQFPCEVFIE